MVHVMYILRAELCLHKNFIRSTFSSFSSSTPPQSTSEYPASNMNSEAYNYYDTSSYWNSYSAWQQGYYESEPTSDAYNNYVSDQKPEEDELELIGIPFSL